MQLRMLTVRSFNKPGAEDYSFDILQFKDSENDKWEDVERDTVTIEEYIKEQQ